MKSLLYDVIGITWIALGILTDFQSHDFHSQGERPLIFITGGLILIACHR